MGTDRSLLAGVLALRADLISSEQFAEACTLSATGENSSLVDLMVERGWIDAADKTHLEYLAARACQRHGEAGRSNVSGPEKTSHSQPVADDHYTLTRIHAQGGMGRVWLAQDHELERIVALKELRPEQTDNSQVASRFLREAKITGQLEHPGITPIYQLGSRGLNRIPYYTMRFVNGPTLSEVVQTYHQERIPGSSDQTKLIELLNAFVAVCNTIAYAHSRGVIHRDIKGQNVILGGFGEVIVLDWGLAKLAGSPESETVIRSPTSDDGDFDDELLTQYGQTMGTPAYMAPEQAAGQINQIGVATDVYGLGALLYEILTGRPPFSGTDSKKLLSKIQNELPVAPRDVVSNVPTPLEAACLKALAKEPENRFGSARELANTVEVWQETQRRAAEDALKASEELYHSLVETIPMNVWRKDAEGRFTFANKGFCDASGRTFEEILGRTDFDLFPQDLAKKYSRDDATVMATGKTFDATEEHSRGSGEKVYVRVVKLPIRDAHGEIVGTQGIFWDESERRRLEDALSKTQAELRRSQTELDRLKSEHEDG